MVFSPELRNHFVLTADDYGIRTTSEPILALARAGKLDRVAVMSRYVSQEEAQAILATGVKLDVHLELIGLMGRGDRLGDGTFFRALSFLSRFLEGSFRQSIVKREWQEQIEKFRQVFGRLPDGLNSHEHIHYFPSFFPVCLALAEKYGIPYVRFGKRGILSPRRRSLIGLILRPLWQFDREKFVRSGLSTSDYVVDLNWIKSFDHLVESLPHTGKVEFIVHPEQPDEGSFIMKNFPPYV